MDIEMSTDCTNDGLFALKEKIELLKKHSVAGELVVTKKGSSLQRQSSKIVLNDASAQKALDSGLREAQLQCTISIGPGLRRQRVEK